MGSVVQAQARDQDQAELSKLLHELLVIHNTVALELSYCHSKTVMPIPWSYISDLINRGLALADEIERKYGKHPRVESIRSWLLFYKTSKVDPQRC
ncbi:MAG: hypothetical protein QXE92_03230 [Thermofilaceae archaeon]